MKHIIANFKASLTEEEVNQWIKEFRNSSVSLSSNLEVVICPAFVHLDEFKPLLDLKKVKLGVQDLSPQPQGAFTGEITAQALKKEGVTYALLGHSERRRHFKETNEIVLEKVKQALKYKIIPIICVDRNNFPAQIKLINQLSLDQELLLFAYEPLSAIGTGKPEKPEAVARIAQEIKKLSNYPVLYGGSVNLQNAASFLKQANIDGLLISTASLKAQTFLEILKIANE